MSLYTEPWRRRSPQNFKDGRSGRRTLSTPPLPDILSEVPGLGGPDEVPLRKAEDDPMGHV